jgi:hypothetical protein
MCNRYDTNDDRWPNERQCNYQRNEMYRLRRGFCKATDRGIERKYDREPYRYENRSIPGGYPGDRTHRRYGSYTQPPGARNATTNVHNNPMRYAEHTANHGKYREHRYRCEKHRGYSRDRNGLVMKPRRSEEFRSSRSPRVNRSEDYIRSMSPHDRNVVMHDVNTVLYGIKPSKAQYIHYDEPLLGNHDVIIPPTGKDMETDYEDTNYPREGSYMTDNDVYDPEMLYDPERV